MSDGWKAGIRNHFLIVVRIMRCHWATSLPTALQHFWIILYPFITTIVLQVQCGCFYRELLGLYYPFTVFSRVVTTLSSANTLFRFWYICSSVGIPIKLAHVALTDGSFYWLFIAPSIESRFGKQYNIIFHLHAICAPWNVHSGDSLGRRNRWVIIGQLYFYDYF